MQELSKEKQEKMQEEGIDVQLTASVSAEGTGSLSVDASVKVSDKQTEKFEKAVENVKIVSISSSPPKDSKKLKLNIFQNAKSPKVKCVQ